MADAKLVHLFWKAFDWEKHSLSDLMYHLFDMVAFADAWAAIERRWADGDYSVRTRAYRWPPSPRRVPCPLAHGGLGGLPHHR